MYSVFFIVLCTASASASASVCSCLFGSFVQVYRPLPLDGNQIAIKINIVSYRIISVAKLQSNLLFLVSGQKTADMSCTFVTPVSTILQTSNPKAVIYIYVQLLLVPTADPAHSSELFGHRSRGIGRMKCL